MSSFLIDMLPKYAQFQPFLSSQSLSSTHSTINTSHTTTNSSTNNSLVSTAQTPNSEGSPLTTTGSEGSPTSQPTSHNNNHKMYPFVSNHPTTHTSY
jgi:hypothetical protein